MSLPSPGSHWNDVVAGAEQGGVVALVAVDEVVAVAAEQRVVAVAAEDVSLPAPPSMVSLIRAARLPAAEIMSSPPLALTTRFSVVPMSSAERRRIEPVEAHARRRWR